MLNPAQELGAFFGGGASDLVRHVGSHVAIDENYPALIEDAFDSGLGFKAIAGIKKRRKMGIDFRKRAEVAIQEFADHAAEPGIVLRETRGIYGKTLSGKGMLEKLGLGVLAAAINSLDGDE
jgi:hypothetical protein